MGIESLSPAGTITVDQNGQKIPLVIAALFRTQKSDQLYAFVWKGNSEIEEGFAFSEINSSHTPIGSVVPLRKIIPDAGNLGNLFAAVPISADVSKWLGLEMQQAAISKDVTDHIFGDHSVRVRRLAPQVEVTRRRARRSNKYTAPVGKTGFLTGDITNPAVGAAGKEITLRSVALAQGRGTKSFARPGDGGLPVVSKSGALLGFIIAISKDGTLVLPAEDVERTLDINFVAPRRRPVNCGPTIRTRAAAAA